MDNSIMEDLIVRARRVGAQEIIFSNSNPVMIRMGNKLIEAGEKIIPASEESEEIKKVSADQNLHRKINIRKLIDLCMYEEMNQSDSSERCKDKLSGNGHVTCTIAAFEGARLHAYTTPTGEYGVIIKFICPTPRAEELFTSRVIDLLKNRSGLILVTGPSQSGRTTTVDSLIDYINRKIGGRILIIRDMVERYHKSVRNDSILIHQVENDINITGFCDILRLGLSRGTDVFATDSIGKFAPYGLPELLKVAESCLVIAEFDALYAKDAVEEFIEMALPDKQESVCKHLSHNLLGIIAQQLVPNIEGGITLAREIMITTPAIKNLIQENKIYRIPSSIQTGARHGMITLDDHLIRLHQDGFISAETMMEYALMPDEIVKKLNQVVGEVKE